MADSALLLSGVFFHDSIYANSFIMDHLQETVLEQTEFRNQRQPDRDLALRLTDVCKRFGRSLAVDHLSMQVKRGTVYGFLGPNGAGKTTTLRIIMSILHPDSGEVEVLNEADAGAVKDRLGYLPEERGLYRKMKVEEVLVYFGRLKGMQAAEASRRARELVTIYGEEAWLKLRCESLSKGMGQKIQILGSLIHRPDLVILDEPFSGLDPVNVEMMRRVVQEMKAEGRTVIFSTHNMEQAEQLCDAVLLIHRGRKLLDGSLSQVKASGGRGILLDYNGDGSFLQHLPDVERVNDSGKQAEIFLKAGANPQDFLQSIVQRIEVRRFDLREPSLHEIFVRAVTGAENA